MHMLESMLTTRRHAYICTPARVHSLLPTYAHVCHQQQDLVKDREILREPIVRTFLKLPMNEDEVEDLQSQVGVSQ